MEANDAGFQRSLERRLFNYRHPSERWDPVSFVENDNRTSQQKTDFFD
jgi:hypothetical protein